MGKVSNQPIQFLLWSAEKSLLSITLKRLVSWVVKFILSNQFDVIVLHMEVVMVNDYHNAPSQARGWFETLEVKYEILEDRCS